LIFAPAPTKISQLAVWPRSGDPFFLTCFRFFAFDVGQICCRSHLLTVNMFLFKKLTSNHCKINLKEANAPNCGPKIRGGQLPTALAFA
jgi:hypothetical protein